MSSKVECPLCTQIGFPNVDALRLALVSAASRSLTCPICQASLTGLDKLTVHLFSHTLPQHELQNSVHCNARNNVNLINSHQQHMPPSTVVNATAMVTQELNPKIGVSGNDIPQNVGNFQTEKSIFKTHESAPIFNQDISNLLYWLPVSCVPEKLINSSQNAAGSVNSDGSNTRLVNCSSQINQESDNLEKVSGKPESGSANKGTSFIIVSIPPLQELKKQSEIKPNSNNDKLNTNELSLSEVSNLSGKLLMLECGNDTYNTGMNVDKSPKQFTVGISLRSEQQPALNTLSNGDLPPNHEVCNNSREISASSYHLDVRNEGGGVESKLPQYNNNCLKESAETVRCHLCHIQFTDSNILALHHQLVHEGANSAQHNVGSSPISQYSPKQNKGLSEGKDEERFQCHLCSKKYDMQGSLMVHIRVAHTAPGFVGLASRVKENTSATSPTSAASTAASAAVKNLKDSSQAKVDNKQWECSECGKFFTTKYFLKKHKRLHTGEMPYSCPTCGKSFTFQQSYHKHLLYHSDEKPHTCTDCGRSFKELSTLHNHQRIHTGEKPWSCETCGKCFRQRVSYLVHRRIHTGAMPYCCTACNKNFRYKVSQRTHKCTAQPPGSVVRQPGDLLQRLLFGNSGEERSTESPGNGKEIDQAKLTREGADQGTFQENRPAEETRTSVESVRSHEQGAQLFFSVGSDKSVFPDRLGMTAPDFSLQNFALQQQILPNLQGGSNVPQGSAVLQNASVNSGPKHNTSDEVPMNVCNSNWCAEDESTRKNSCNLTSSSLVVVLNEKESVIPVSLPDPRTSIALLQVLQKDKCVPNDGFTDSLRGGSSNDLRCSSTRPSDATKHNNMVVSTPCVPDFLSMVISASNQNQNSGSGCGDNNVPIGDPFQWEVSLDMPNNVQNDGINNSASASQETMESLQSLLFGGPSAQL